jgi:hypothetical protein
VGDRKQDSASIPRVKTIIGQAMTHTERQARYRTEPAETHAAPSQPADRRYRLQRLRDIVARLQELQRAYQAWLDVLPRNIQMGLGYALRSRSFYTTSTCACRSQWPPTGDDHSIYKTRPPCSRGRVGSILTPSPRVALARTAREVRRSDGYQISRGCQIRVP